ncbi:MAG: hypothetical protein ABSG53_00110 [Thermoguttaceae bacterium]|jgi:hypothetical protein
MNEQNPKPGPWHWQREKYDPDGPWFCTLVTDAPIETVPWRDRMVLAMREDCAQFLYAGTSPSELLIAAAPELLQALKDLSEWGRTYTSPLDKNSPHKLLIAAVNAISKAQGVTHEHQSSYRPQD